MTCNRECSPYDRAMELLIEHGFDEKAENTTMLVNKTVWLFIN